jgi:L-lactate dehydrogenase complex protein LldG
MAEKSLSEQAIADKFETMAQSVQAVVYHVKTIQEAFSRAVETTAAQKGATLAAVGFKDEEANILKSMCDEKGITFLSPPFRDHLQNIHTAVTPVDWGIAETGTLVIDSLSEDIRIATMLSETHVACLSKSRIRSESMEIESFLDDRLKKPNGYTAFITGASRTADIERVLTIGVHGPQELHVCILEDNQS